MGKEVEKEGEKVTLAEEKKAFSFFLGTQKQQSFSFELYYVARWKAEGRHPRRIVLFRRCSAEPTQTVLLYPGEINPFLHLLSFFLGLLLNYNPEHPDYQVNK